MTKQVITSRLRANLYKIVHDIDNDSTATDILNKFSFDNIVDIVEDNVSNGKLSKSGYSLMINTLGIKYSSNSSNDFMHFRSLIYGVNDVILSWIALITFDDSWQVPLPMELLELMNFLLEKLFVFENNVSLPLSRKIELSPAFVSFNEYLKHNYVDLKLLDSTILEKFEGASNLYLLRMGSQAPFNVPSIDV